MADFHYFSGRSQQEQQNISNQQKQKWAIYIIIISWCNRSMARGDVQTIIMSFL